MIRFSSEMDQGSGDCTHYDDRGISVCGPTDPSSSHDLIVGGEGDDSLDGDPALDIFDGGPGTNVIKFHDNTACLGISAVPTPEDTPLGVVSHTISIEFAATARASINGSVYEFPLDLVNCVYIETALGNDSVSIDATVNLPTTLVGGDGNDTLVSGSSTPVSIHRGNGDVQLVGNDGTDTIDGGAGDDPLDGGGGADLLDGGDDQDLISGGSDSDTMLGSAGNDTLNADSGNDAMDGGDDVLTAGDDGATMLGGPGNDTLVGGQGFDSLDGDHRRRFAERRRWRRHA